MIDEGFPESTLGHGVPVRFESLGYLISRDPVIALGELGLLRDTMVPKLISGELRVRDAERIAERV